MTIHTTMNELGQWVEIAVCRGCGCPVEDCDCRAVEQQRERRDNSVMVGDSIPRRGRKSLFGDEPPF